MFFIRQTGEFKRLITVGGGSIISKYEVGDGGGSLL